jgi:ElaB/YqjD/DUF883 family membrane-anchored ribosome-binding protein
MSKYATQVGNTANDVIDKTENTARKFANKAENTMDELESKAYNIAETLGSTLKEWLDTNGKRAVEVKDSAEQTIKSHPLAATMAAFAGGWILSAILGSGRRS